MYTEGISPSGKVESNKRKYLTYADTYCFNQRNELFISYRAM